MGTLTALAFPASHWMVPARPLLVWEEITGPSPMLLGGDYRYCGGRVRFGSSRSP
jgi:hypothetical protein